MIEFNKPNNVSWLEEYLLVTMKTHRKPEAVSEATIYLITRVEKNEFVAAALSCPAL